MIFISPNRLTIITNPEGKILKMLPSDWRVSNLVGQLDKVGLILVSFFTMAETSKKQVPNHFPGHSPQHYLAKEKMLKKVIWPKFAEI